MTDYIRLAHGGGGSLMQELINKEIVPALGGVDLAHLGDCAKLEVGSTLAFTTDSFVVQPLVFPALLSIVPGEPLRLKDCRDYSLNGRGPGEGTS